MSVPLLLFMVSVDQGVMAGADPLIWVPITLVIGFVITYVTYKKVPSVKGF